MAKKKKSAKKQAAKVTVKSILKELNAEVTKGLGKKKLSPPARKYWTELYTKSISDRLAAGGDWALARKRVLKAAKKLGAVARVLTDGKNVSKVIAQLASDTVALYPGCPGPGSGEWCPPAGAEPGE